MECRPEPFEWARYKLDAIDQTRPDTELGRQLRTWQAEDQAVARAKYECELEGIIARLRHGDPLLPQEKQRPDYKVAQSQVRAERAEKSHEWKLAEQYRMMAVRDPGLVSTGP